MDNNRNERETIVVQDKEPQNIVVPLANNASEQPLLLTAGSNQSSNQSAESMGKELATEAGQQDTEFAADIVPGIPYQTQRRNTSHGVLIEPEDDRPQIQSQSNNGAKTAGRGMGITAIVLAIISLFILPVLLGPVSIVLGYLAYSKGQRSLGLWSMVLGALAFLAAVLFLPYVR